MKLENMLPFLDDEDMEELVQNIIEGKINVPITKVLPFLDDEIADKLYRDAVVNPDKYGVSPNVFLPFVSEECVDEMFLEQQKKGNTDVSMLPFVSDECLSGLVDEYVRNPDMQLNVDVLYPFLDDDDISKLFKTYIKRNAK